MNITKLDVPLNPREERVIREAMDALIHIDPRALLHTTPRHAPEQHDASQDLLDEFQAMLRREGHAG